MTGLPSIDDDFGTLDLDSRVAKYHPGWYIAWNELDDDKADAITPLYQPVRVAAFPALDDPDRNLLIVYRLDPKAPTPPVHPAPPPHPQATSNEARPAARHHTAPALVSSVDFEIHIHIQGDRDRLVTTCRWTKHVLGNNEGYLLVRIVFHGFRNP